MTTTAGPWRRKLGRDGKGTHLLPLDSDRPLCGSRTRRYVLSLGPTSRPDLDPGTCPDCLDASDCGHYTDRECHAAGCAHECTPRTCSQATATAPDVARLTARWAVWADNDGGYDTED